jgi:hypothetical protein
MPDLHMGIEPQSSDPKSVCLIYPHQSKVTN